MSRQGTFDFETASSSGHEWNEATRSWDAPRGARYKGLKTVGAAAYSEHPSTRVLTLSYKLPGVWFDQYDRPRTGGVVVRWRPSMGHPPQELFDFLAGGGILEAHKLMFEWLIWQNVCVTKYGWPSLEPWAHQLRCSMMKARVNALPAPLGNLGDVLQLSRRKDKDGTRLLNKFSVPRKPTKGDPRLWITPEEDPEDGERLYRYCDDDVLTEEEASEKMHPATDDELLFWMVDQEINRRGVAIDREAVQDCMAVLEQALEQYGDECREITGFNPTQLKELKGWMAARGHYLDSMDEEALDQALGPGGRMPPHPPGGVYPPRRVLEIRQLIGSASVKKLYAMEHQACGDNRLRDLIAHHGARTGRPTGEGPQPLNLPKAGPELRWCGDAGKGQWFPVGCRKPFKASFRTCPWCSAPAVSAKREWGVAVDKATGATYNPVDTVLEVMRARCLALVEYYFEDALLAISGCVRGLFVAAPGHDFIASDYTAIEGVVIAQLAGEQWRIDAYRNFEPIYLLSASKITGTPLQVYLDYAAQNSAHHPDRQKIGKVAELAGGFGGWIGAWMQFGFEGTDEEAKQQILAWRAASPAIVEFWGGQTRGAWRDRRQEYYGLEGAAVQAISYPGMTFETHGVAFYMRGHKPRILGEAKWNDAWGFWEENVLEPGDSGALIVRLPSGRELTYHSPRLSPSTRDYDPPWALQITYMTWNTNPKYGPKGWVPMSTYGGRLAENVTQAVAHDILRFAILNLRAAGYPTVIHVYDEILVEVPEGLGSVEEVERIMSIMPPWAHDWPIRASGGWRGKRYRKG